MTIKRMHLRRVAALALLLASAGCLPASSEASFTGGNTEVSCDGVYPVCKGKYAGCVLTPEQFIRGNFPGSRKFLVETGAGDWTIRVLFFLDRQRAPGSETEVSWYEPGCSDQYDYKLSKQAQNKDLFQIAGRDQVLAVEQAVTEAGDHLVEIYSDATCRYALKVEVVRTRP